MEIYLHGIGLSERFRIFNCHSASERLLSTHYGLSDCLQSSRDNTLRKLFGGVSEIGQTDSQGKAIGGFSHHIAAKDACLYWLNLCCSRTVRPYYRYGSS